MGRGYDIHGFSEFPIGQGLHDVDQIYVSVQALALRVTMQRVDDTSPCLWNS